MSAEYYHWLVSGVALDREEELTDFLFANGCAGVSQNLTFRQSSDRYEPELLDNHTPSWDVYFLKPPSEVMVQSLLERFAGARVHQESLPDQDWLEEWKKGFVPFELCSPYWVVPSWESVPSQAERPLFIDPGMAFGTGTHETTQLMAALLLERLSAQSAPKSFLDIGTGTGILAMMMLQEGVSEVTGVEIDGEACRVARENLQRNQCEAITILEGGPERLSESFEWVAANIIDGVLIQLESIIYDRLAVGGRLFVSGILAERESVFMKQFIGPRWRVERRQELGEWLGFELVVREIQP